jgi:preprotein translocase subunit SecA
MIQPLLASIFGSRNQRLLKQYSKTVTYIATFEAALQALSDDDLKAKTPAFKAQIAAGATLDSILPECFAVVREASRRVMGMRHFDAQMIGGMVLHYGKIAEMRTGEGKTLTATLPVYLNALSGKGVHVVTVNDYLAQRDAEWMAKLYNWLGLTVGINLSTLEGENKQAAYLCDITYGTNNEFGFDYLRDNLVMNTHSRVQRPLNFAIVDEVDSILIDEARTPLIISGAAENHTQLYHQIDGVPSLLTRMTQEPKHTDEIAPVGDYWIDEKQNQIHLSEAGHEKAEGILSDLGLLPKGVSLYSSQNINLMHHIMVALKAHKIYHRNQHYVVKEDEVVIVDEFTGRLMTGRRWGDGLHQAVEAKEGVAIQAESHTLASVTFQNYFRLYTKLGGMTGTADTEAYEFQQIYNLETVVIPTNRPMVRKDLNDLMYRSVEEKYEAICDDVKSCYERKQPVLVGTTSVEQSELISKILNNAGLPHEVLNAKQHEREAQIVAQAGKPKAITVATNMAGRGTDIVLGGNVEKQIQFLALDTQLTPEQREAAAKTLRDEWASINAAVKAAGGLKIVGSERHESRRIDNQLRGRSGRQGDPGESRFYLSMDDELLRIFGGERLKSIMNRLKLPQGEPIEASMVTRSIEGSQRKVESRNFDMRKQLLEYDDIANEQRKIIYQQRNDILDSDTVTINAISTNLRHGTLTALMSEYIPHDSLEEQWDLQGLQLILEKEWAIDCDLTALLSQSTTNADSLKAAVIARADALYQAKIDLVTADSFADFERTLMLQTMDSKWRDHLTALDHLRQGIHLRGYAQKNPKQEYQREAFEMFGALLDHVRSEITRIIMTIKIRDAQEVAQAEAALEAAAVLGDLTLQHGESDITNTSIAADTSNRKLLQKSNNARRNEPCPCGSGKKFKACHGKLS